MGLTVPAYLALVETDSTHPFVIRREFHDYTHQPERDALKSTCLSALNVAAISDAKIIEHTRDLEILLKRRLDWEHFLAAEDFNMDESMIVEVFSRKDRVKASRQPRKIARAYKQAAMMAGVHRSIDIDIDWENNSAVIEAEDKYSYFRTWQFLPASRRASLDMVKASL